MNNGYINIREILSRLLRHPLLSDLSLESVIQYTVDFIGIMGMPSLYETKETGLCIENYRAMLPCDFVSINQVMGNNNECIRYMTGSFDRGSSDNAFKVQGNILYVTFKEGNVTISYNAIPIDEEEYPMLPDNSIFLKTLELYIKKEQFTILFDTGKISMQSLQNCQQEYAFKAGQCTNEFTIPSLSEMESLTNMMSRLLIRDNDFRNGFRNLGTKQRLKIR